MFMLTSEFQQLLGGARFSSFTSYSSRSTRHFVFGMSKIMETLLFEMHSTTLHFGTWVLCWEFALDLFSTIDPPPPVVRRYSWHAFGMA
jgi:hypothetical protein